MTRNLDVLPIGSPPETRSGICLTEPYYTWAEHDFRVGDPSIPSPTVMACLSSYAGSLVALSAVCALSWARWWGCGPCKIKNSAYIILPNAHDRDLRGLESRS
jgi:hypothetical protein